MAHWHWEELFKCCNKHQKITNTLAKGFFAWGLNFEMVFPFGLQFLQRRSCGISCCNVHVNVMFKKGLASLCIYGLLLHCTWEGAFYGCVVGLWTWGGHGTNFCANWCTHIPTFVLSKVCWNMMHDNGWF